MEETRSRWSRPHCPTCGGFLASGATECAACPTRDARRSPVPPDRRCKGCGRPARPEGRWCKTCIEEHLHESARRRDRQRRGRLSPSVRRTILARVARGEHLPDVAADLGVTMQAVWGAALVWPWWREELDAALVAGRDPGLAHGTEQAYRHSKCRCPDCRGAHHAP